jgi:hypothetical protein
MSLFYANDPPADKSGASDDCLVPLVDLLLSLAAAADGEDDAPDEGRGAAAAEGEKGGGK